MDEPHLRARRALIPWRVWALARFGALGATAHFVHGRLPLPLHEREALVVHVPASASTAERDALVQTALLRDVALSQGAAYADPLVREALVSDMRALGGNTRADDAALVDAALRQGLAETDAFVRERLRSLGEALVLRDVQPEAPSDTELLAYLRAHAARYGAVPRSTVSLVVLTGVGAEARAAAALSALRGPAPPAAASVHEQPLFPSVLRAQTRAQLSSRLGAAAALALEHAPLGQWHGPLACPFGLLLARLDEQAPAVVPALDTVRPRVLADHEHDARAVRLAAAVAELRARRRVELRAR